MDSLGGVGWGGIITAYLVEGRVRWEEGRALGKRKAALVEVVRRQDRMP